LFTQVHPPSSMSVPSSTRLDFRLPANDRTTKGSVARPYSCSCSRQGAGTSGAAPTKTMSSRRHGRPARLMVALAYVGPPVTFPSESRPSTRVEYPGVLASRLCLHTAQKYCPHTCRYVLLSKCLFSYAMVKSSQVFSTIRNAWERHGLVECTMYPLPTRVTAPPRSSARHAIPCDVVLPEFSGGACHAKLGVRMYEQPSCICLSARRGSTPSAERSGTPSRSAPVPTLEGGGGCQPPLTASATHRSELTG
jgi:hypothetical protein